MFVEATGTRKSVHLTMITPRGLAESTENNRIQNEVVLDDLFA